MIEEIMTNLYRVEIPLPKNPLKFINSYVAKGPERNLVTDTGMNREECKKAMLAALGKLGVDLRKTDFFITHFHVDHLGLVSSLRGDKATVYLSQPDTERLDKLIRGRLWADMVDFTLMNGFPKFEIQEIFDNHPAIRYGFKGHLFFKFLKDEDTINIGSFVFKCVKTPGHTQGHMCLHELSKKIFIAGDHILNDITPIISLRSDDENPLEEYLASLDKVYALKNIELVLPGHGNILRNCKQRVKALKHHHEMRAEEITSILKRGSKNAYQVASQMRWDIPCDSWDRFPVLQKWFAIGETIAHIKYLEEKRMVRKEMWKQGLVYSLNVNP